MTRLDDMIAVNEHGQPIGEDHPRSLYSNRDIELMRQLYEQGVGPSEIARKFDAKKRFVIKVVKYQARVAYADRFVRKEAPQPLHVRLARVGTEMERIRKTNAVEATDARVLYHGAHAAGYRD